MLLCSVEAPAAAIEGSAKGWIIFLLIASFALFSAAVVYFLRQHVLKKKSLHSQKACRHYEYRSLRYRLLVFTGLLFVSVWCVRFAVDLFVLKGENVESGISATGGWNSVFGCILHAFQTISFDEDYDNYIKTGQLLIRTLCGGETVWAFWHGFYASLLNVLAPVAGGAVVVEFLSEFFPKIALWRIRNFYPKQKKYYFSELNEKSLALAKDVVRKAEDPVRIVFADVLRDDAAEDARDLIDEAQRYGAVCVRDDIMLIRFTPGKPVRFLQRAARRIAARFEIAPAVRPPVCVFLIDENENSNLQMLTSLLARKDEVLKKADIYVFQSDDKDSRFEEEVSFIINQQKRLILEGLPAGEDRDAALRERLPSVTPVNGVRNMAMLQMMRMPLFEPLADRAAEEGENKQLHVVIFGSGVIGTELFLNATWFGQMLDYTLHITMVSKEAQTADPAKKKEGALKNAPGGFEDRLNRLNPEILRSGDETDPLLAYDGENRNPPYFYYKYVEADVMLGDLKTTLEAHSDTALPLTDADYYIVALGSDEDNFTLADQLRQIVGCEHMKKAAERKQAGTPQAAGKKTVISYVVYNADLCSALNEKCGYCYAENGCDVYMRAFGSMEEVYSMDAVMFNCVRTDAADIGEKYDEKNSGQRRGRNLSAAQKKKEAESNEKKRGEEKLNRSKDSYSFYSDIARRLFRRYMAFSAGETHDSVFSLGDGELLQRGLERMEENFRRSVFSLENVEEKRALHRRLAWLEHRRWCAFMRSKGFRNPEGSLSQYVSLRLTEHADGENKIIPLKLHGCLAEAGADEIQAVYDDAGFLVTGTQRLMGTAGDRLDMVNAAVDAALERTLQKEKAEAEKSKAPGAGNTAAPQPAAKVLPRETRKMRKTARKQRALIEKRAKPGSRSHAEITAARATLESAAARKERSRWEPKKKFYKLWDYPQYGYGSEETLDMQYDLWGRPHLSPAAADSAISAADVHRINGVYYAQPWAAAAAVCAAPEISEALACAKDKKVISLAVAMAAEEMSEDVNARDSAGSAVRVKLFPLQSLTAFYEKQRDAVPLLVYCQNEKQ